MVDTSPRALARSLPWPLREPAETAIDHIQQGTFQRSMSLLVAGTSVVSGLEVAYEHYKGSYSNPVMYSPVILSGVLATAAVAGFFSRVAARTFLRYASYITLADGVIGFGFHIRGIARKPGGWRLPITNIVMGPPIFAPLLFGTSAYLGVIASYLQREEDFGLRGRARGIRALAQKRFSQRYPHGTLSAASLRSGGSGNAGVGCGELVFALQGQLQIPRTVVAHPAYAADALRYARFPQEQAYREYSAAVASALLMLNGTIGVGYHLRGILQRPGGKKKPLYNILYGPPIFAPMLFAACGLLGMLAYLMRREPRA